MLFGLLLMFYTIFISNSETRSSYSLKFDLHKRKRTDKANAMIVATDYDWLLKTLKTCEMYLVWNKLPDWVAWNCVHTFKAKVWLWNRKDLTHLLYLPKIQNMTSLLFKAWLSVRFNLHNLFKVIMFRLKKKIPYMKPGFET